MRRCRQVTRASHRRVSRSRMGLLGTEELLLVCKAEDEQGCAKDRADGKSHDDQGAVDDEEPEEPGGAVSAPDEGHDEKDEAGKGEKESGRRCQQHELHAGGKLAGLGDAPGSQRLKCVRDAEDRPQEAKHWPEEKRSACNGENFTGGVRVAHGGELGLGCAGYTATARDSRTALSWPAEPSFTLRLAMKVAYSFMKILPGGRKSNCSGWSLKNSR